MMPLTTQEKRAIVETANWWSTAGWGVPGIGWSPEGVVARLRGGRFAGYRDEYLPCSSDYRIAAGALRDVHEWLGLTFTQYLHALNEEGPSILKRAPEMRHERRED